MEDKMVTDRVSIIIFGILALAMAIAYKFIYGFDKLIPPITAFVILVASAVISSLLPFISKKMRKSDD